MKKPIPVVVCSFFLLLSIQNGVAQYQIPFNVISGGGEKLSSAGFILNSTVGEAFIGKSINDSHQKYSGFWYVYEQSTITDVNEQQEILPTEFKLEQNYPNPFNPTTSIKYSVPQKSNVLIKIYNIVGEEVAKLVNEEKDQGWYTIIFSSTGLASGIYVYKMQADNYISTKKMMLIK